MSEDGDHPTTPGTGVIGTIDMAKIRRIFLIILVLIAVPAWSQQHETVRQAADSTVVPDIIVSAEGGGNYRTLGEAFQSLPLHPGRRFTIFVCNGRYREKLRIPPSSSHLRIIGESRDDVILTYDDHSGKPAGGDTLNTWSSWSTSVDADDCMFENVTFENSAGRVGQAVAIMVTGDKIQFRNCRFRGNQDTFFANTTGRVYLKDCLIEGTTDFTFGAGIVYFDHCTLHSKKKSHVTAASTPQGNRFGFVFSHCRLTADSGLTGVSLGRPWRPYARVVYLECEIGPHIGPEGWNNWRNPENEKTAYYAEYRCSGPGAARDHRVAWSHELTDAEARDYTIGQIFSAEAHNPTYPDSWNPLSVR